MSKFRLLSCSSLVVQILSLLIIVNLVHADEREFRTGPCKYDTYKGRARIVSISKLKEKQYSGRYEVRFTFEPEQEIKQKFAWKKGEEFLFRPNHSFPKGDLLEKYGITVGKEIDCDLLVIVEGTCTPVLFEYPSIDSKKSKAK